MKTIITKLTVSSLLMFALLPLAHGSDISKKMDGLGGNRDLIKKARALDPDNKIRVVQNRTVDRNWRFELGVNYSALAGGDPYLNTQSVGGNLDIHINPMWSVGARYSDYSNQLTTEGERVFKDASERELSGNPYIKPDIDFLKSSTLAVISFYPVYGKLNMFDMGVAQFDLYMIGGYGQVQLESGSSSTWTAGGGAGIWLSEHFASRLEVRYQNYQDQIYSGVRDMDLVVTTFSIGFIL
ncbi:MAG: outer membrane beta-barrel domain-containing protein [Bdellovibrionales bacterium]|nr:outer membrane beta-barrel domain-containing protein [Bdellovibrionales bacterium]